MRAAILVLLLAAAAQARPRPRRPRGSPPVPTEIPAVPDPNELSPEDGQIALRFFDHFIDIVKGAKDCSAVAARINFVIDRNRELVRLMAEATARGKKIPKAVQDKMTARMMTELMPVIQKCTSDQDVLDALNRFQPRKPQPALH